MSSEKQNDYVQGQIFEPIFGPTEGYCVFSFENWGISPGLAGEYSVT